MMTSPELSRRTVLSAGVVVAAGLFASVIGTGNAVATVQPRRHGPASLDSWLLRTAKV